jgi:four helix bundle protein
MSKISSFEDIEVWKKSVELCEKIYLLTESSSLKQDFGLRDQIRRSAISIPSNIAEGFERESNNQFIYFLIIAKGSCGELRTQLFLAMKIKHIDELTHGVLREDCLTISKQLSNFIKYLKSTKLKNQTK